MSVWDPERYLAFTDQRSRPALELLARVFHDSPETVVDLGCGPGNITPYLRARWPTASHIGIDSSAEMLAVASATYPEEIWVNADASTWTADTPVDVIYSNAALHWVDDHATVLMNLVSELAAGGTLAVQMPANFGEPTHTTITEVVRSRRWSVDLAGLLRPTPVSEPAWYHELLAPMAASLDIWTTTYLQELSGEDAVTNWVRGSALRPFLTALGEPAEREEFLGEYRTRITDRYQRSASGITVLPFTRLFIVIAIAT